MILQPHMGGNYVAEGGLVRLQEGETVICKLHPESPDVIVIDIAVFGNDE